MADPDMRHFWDERAREDALLYVDDRGRRGAEFWSGGEEVVRAFEEHLLFDVRGGVIVEIGCGIGRVTRALAQRAESVVAIDISPEMLARARELNPELAGVDWVQGDGATLAPVADASADGVFSHVVFQHLPDPDLTLGYVREMGRVLRPDGWAAFQVSNDPSVHRRRLLARRPTRHPAWRGSAVDLGALGAAAHDAGLEVAHVIGEGTQFCLVRLQASESPRAPGARRR
jgi:SAM-dependent methyltransferase